MNAKTQMFGMLALALLVLTSACGPTNKPGFIFMPDMVYSPALKAQKEGSMRMPPAGTVPRDIMVYPAAYKADPELAGRELKGPQMTKALMLQGQAKFNTYCAVCHGPEGMGNGSIIPKFPQPPSLHSDKVKGWTDGRIYHVISAGQNLMPPYASQVQPQDRWAIVYYIRALQRAKNPSEADLKAAQSM